MTAEIRFRVEREPYYVEGDLFASGDDALDREDWARVQSGEWGVFALIAETQCACCGSWNVTDSLGMIVVDDNGQEGTYPDAESIPDAYLRECAADMGPEVTA